MACKADRRSPSGVALNYKTAVLLCTAAFYVFCFRNCEEISLKFMLRIICSVQGTRPQEYCRVFRECNAVQGKSDKQKLKVIDEQFLTFCVYLFAHKERQRPPSRVQTGLYRKRFFSPDPCPRDCLTASADD